MDEQKIIEAFHLMWDHFPEPVLLIKKIARFTQPTGKRFLSVWTNRYDAATGETLNSIKAAYATGLSTKNARPASFTTARLAKPMDIGCL